MSALCLIAAVLSASLAELAHRVGPHNPAGRVWLCAMLLLPGAASILGRLA